MFEKAASAFHRKGFVGAPWPCYCHGVPPSPTMIGSSWECLDYGWIVLALLYCPRLLTIKSFRQSRKHSKTRHLLWLCMRCLCVKINYSWKVDCDFRQENTRPTAHHITPCHGMSCPIRSYPVISYHMDHTILTCISWYHKINFAFTRLPSGLKLKCTC